YQDKAKADAAAEDGRFDFNTALTAATTLYAGWEQKEVFYSITFYAGEGATFEDNGNDTFVIEGITPNTEIATDDDRLPSPQKDKAAFVDWYTSSEYAEEHGEEGVWDYVVTADTILYAGWAAIYTVTFHAGEGLFEDGTDTYEIETIEDTVCDIDELPELVKLGYDFEWWYLDEDLTEEWDADEPITADIDLYACYIAAEYDITFDANKGTFPSVVEILTINKLYGETISKADLITPPTKFGYDFLDWCKDPEGNEQWNYELDMVTENITLYASWTKKDIPPAPEFKGYNGMGIPINGTFIGTIEGEEVEIVFTPAKYEQNVLVSPGSIVWEGHVIEIVSIVDKHIFFIVNVKIDGVEVQLTKMVDDTLKISREDYNDIILPNKNRKEIG
ncbi:MAG: InlB B-repeat-containing protein, partial [Clostridiales bacterium]|nr:InlB B-repeat-containing protein [Clostridiales bacterium]